MKINLQINKKIMIIIIPFVLALFLVTTAYLLHSNVKSSSDNFNENIVGTLSISPNELGDVRDRNIEFILNDEVFTTNINDFGLDVETEATEVTQLIAKILNKKVDYSIALNLERYENTKARIQTQFRQDTPAIITKTGDDWDYSPALSELQIDTNSLVIEIVDKLSQSYSAPLRLNLNDFSSYKKDSLSNETVMEYKKALLSPINFKYDSKTFTLTNSEINQVISPRIENNVLTVGINRTKLKKLLEKKLNMLEEKEVIHIDDKIINNNDKEPDYEALLTQTSQILKDRTNGTDTREDIEVTLISPPATNGDLFDRYIEVDLSQQKLYIWDNKKLFLEESTSTGAEGRTPVGKFEIINKADLAWSDTANKWMPNWMAFYYKTFDSGLKAWLGFHAVTWWYDEDGKKVFEPDTNVGTPLSGGCIKLAREPQKKFFDWAKVGDIAIIHE